MITMGLTNCGDAIQEINDHTSQLVKQRVKRP